MKLNALINVMLSFTALMAFWVLMSGFLDAIHLSLGVLTVASVLLLNRQLKSHQFFSDDMENISSLRFHRAFMYLFWLLYQILIAGFHVLLAILRPKMNTRPAIVTFRADLPSAHAKVILGNSITLTPGTLTVDIEGDRFTVHALDEQSYAGILSDEMPRQVLNLFSSEDRQVVSDISIKPKPRN